MGDDSSLSSTVVTGDSLVVDDGGVGGEYADVETEGVGVVIEVLGVGGEGVGGEFIGAVGKLL